MSLNVSGFVGYSILINKKNNKLIVLLADIHDGVKYCYQNNIYVDELMNKLLKYNNIKILLEEVPRKNIKLIELWPSSIHTQRLKEWFLKNEDKIEPIDIRPFLVPFSYQKYLLNDINDEENKMKINEYLGTIDSLFFLNNRTLDNGLFFIKNLVKGLNDKESDSGITKIYKMIKYKYINLREKIDVSKTFNEAIKDNINWFKDLEEIKINLMDWYTIILLLGSKHSVCHFGLAHFENVKNMLINVFDCELIFQDGINNISNDLKTENILACIKLLK